MRGFASFKCSPGVRCGEGCLLEAVQEWVYAPTQLNGQPVEVQAPIQVTFVLNR